MLFASLAVAVFGIVVPEPAVTLKFSCMPIAASVFSEKGSRLPSWQVTTLPFDMQGEFVPDRQLTPLFEVKQTTELWKAVPVGTGSVTVNAVAVPGPRFSTAIP